MTTIQEIKHFLTSKGIEFKGFEEHYQKSLTDKPEEKHWYKCWQLVNESIDYLRAKGLDVSSNQLKTEVNPFISEDFWNKPERKKRGSGFRTTLRQSAGLMVILLLLFTSCKKDCKVCKEYKRNSKHYLRGTIEVSTTVTDIEFCDGVPSGGKVVAPYNGRYSEIDSTWYECK
jgi:hypothetical protein